jgi:hypothetical protein
MPCIEQLRITRPCRPILGPHFAFKSGQQTRPKSKVFWLLLPEAGPQLEQEARKRQRPHTPPSESARSLQCRAGLSSTLQGSPVRSPYSVPADASNTANQNDRCLAPPCGEHHAGMQSVPLYREAPTQRPCGPGELGGEAGSEAGKADPARNTLGYCGFRSVLC